MRILIFWLASCLLELIWLQITETSPSALNHERERFLFPEQESRGTVVHIWGSGIFMGPGSPASLPRFTPPVASVFVFSCLFLRDLNMAAQLRGAQQVL